MTEKTFLEFEDELIEYEENGEIIITDTRYRVFSDGSKEVACSTTYPKPSEEVVSQNTAYNNFESEILMMLLKQQNQLNAIEAKLDQIINSL